MAQKLLDFKDIQDAVIEQLGIQASDTTSISRIKRIINMVYTQEVVPHKRWKWLYGHTRVIHEAAYGSSSGLDCQVTPGSTTVTLNQTPDASLGSFKGYLFAVTAFDEVYEVASHTAGDTAITLTSAFKGSLGAETTFRIWRDRVDLPTNCRETQDVWIDRKPGKLKGVGLQEFRKLVSEHHPKAEAMAEYYNTTGYYDPSPADGMFEADRYRQLLIYPSLTTEDYTINIDYIKEVDDLDDDADEPIIPIEDRVVLLYGTLAQTAIGHVGSQDESFTMYWTQQYEKKLSRMAGGIEDSFDMPTLMPSSNYTRRRGRSRIRGGFGAMNYSSGGGSAGTTFLEGVTINGATITGNVSVSASVTIDDRDISVDGAALDLLDGAVTTQGDMILGNASGEASTLAIGLANQVLLSNGTTASWATITNANIQAAAAIDLSKLATVTASRALQSSAAGVIEASAVTSTELGYVSGVTSALQTQLNAKLDDFSGTTDNVLIRTDGASGDAVQESGVVVDDSDNVSGIGTLTTTGLVTSGAGVKADAEATVKELASTPTTPASGYQALYPKTDGNWYFLDDAGNEIQVGSGSGGGSINYVTTPDAETGVTDSSTTTNTSVAEETVSPLVGSKSYAFTTTTSATASDNFEILMDDIDPAYIGKRVTVSFLYKTDANFTSDDLEVVLYNDDSASEVTINSNISGDGKLKDTSTEIRQFIGTAQLDATDNSYSLRFKVLSAPASDSTIVIDEVKVSPESFYNTPIEQHFRANVTSGAHGTSGSWLTVTGWSQDFLDAGLGTFNTSTGKFTFSGSGTVKISAAVGFAANATGFRGIRIVKDDGTTTELTHCLVNAAAGGADTFINADTLMEYSDGDEVYIEAIQTSGGSLNYYSTGSGGTIFNMTAYRSTLMSTTQANLQTVKALYRVSASTANSSFASAVAEVVDFDTKIEDNWNTVTTGASWVFTAPIAGEYRVSSSFFWNGATNMTRSILAVRVNGTERQRVFDTASALIEAMNGSTTVKLSAGDTIDITAYHVDSGAAARSVYTGGVPYTEVAIERIPDHEVIGVYSPYEVVESSNDVLGSYSIAAGQYGDLTSITLTPGKWNISHITHWNSNGATTTTRIIAALGTASGTSSTGVSLNNMANDEKDGTSGTVQTLTCPDIIVDVPSTTTYYLKAFATTSTTNLQIAYRITARRLV